MNTAINPENLPQIRWQNQNVITTELLAQCYGAQEKQIRQNYANNKTRFIEGKHFFKLEGDALKIFKQVSKAESASSLTDWFEKTGLDQVFGQVANSDSVENNRVDKIDSVKIASNVNSLMLWTDKGAVRHAKILDTDQAWDVQERLEESYFHPERKIKIANNHTITNLQAELLKTNPRLKDVLNLTRLGYSQARIGEMLGVKSTAIYRACKRLRECGFVVCADANRLPGGVE